MTARTTKASAGTEALKSEADTECSCRLAKAACEVKQACSCPSGCHCHADEHRERIREAIERYSSKPQLKVRVARGSKC